MQLKAMGRRRLLIIAALYFTFLGGTFITDLSFWPRVVHHVIVTGLLAAWLIAHLRPERSLPVTALDVPLLAFFLASTLATVFAVDPRISIEVLWRLGVHTLLFYIIADLFLAGHGRDVFEALFFTSAVVIIIGFIEFASWYFGLSFIPIFSQGWPQIAGLANPIPPAIHRLEFTLSVSTGLSAYFAMLIPVGLAFALSARTRDTRNAFWLWLIGALIVEGLTFSRGGLLSLAASLPTFALLAFLSDADFKERTRRFLADWRSVAVGSMVLGLLILVGLGWARQNLGGHRAGDVVRLDLWRSALVIFREHPLTGVGPYGYGRALRSVRNVLLARDQMLSPHNQALSTMAEVGLPGLIALLLLGGQFLRVAYQRWQAASGQHRLRIAGAAAGLIGYGVQNQVDTFSATPIMLPVLVLAVFVLQRRMEPPSYARRRRSIFTAASLLALVLLSAVGWAVSDLAQYHFQRSVKLVQQDNLSGALTEAERAERIDSGLGLYAFQRAYVLGRMADDQPAFLDNAIEAYQDALAVEPTSDLHNANLSALLAQSDDLQAAQTQMAIANGILPREHHYIFWLGNYAESLRNFDGAAEWYGQALQGRPDWGESPYWQGSAWRAEFLAERIGRATNESDARLLLATGDLQTSLLVAQQLAEAHRGDVSAQATLGEVALRAGDAESALEALDAALALSPSSARLYALRAEVWLALDDAEHATRDARTALFLDPLGAGRRANYVLAQLAERSGELSAAEEGYIAAGPPFVSSQNWEVALYGRKAAFDYLPQLKAPGPGAYAFEPWLNLIRIYEAQGRDDDTENVYNAIRRQDPFFDR